MSKGKKPVKGPAKEPVKKSIVREYVEAIVIAGIMAAFIMTFIARSYAVDGMSMVPTLHNRERLLVDKLSYRFIDPKRGEIVVLKPPFPSPAPFIKRVIGLPGDQIYIHNGEVQLNGKTLREDYINEPVQGEFGPYVVPPGSYFVMGDNRNHSEDSRFVPVGYIPKTRIVGRALVRYWPLTALSVVQRPEVLRSVQP